MLPVFFGPLAHWYSRRALSLRQWGFGFSANVQASSHASFHSCPSRKQISISNRTLDWSHWSLVSPTLTRKLWYSLRTFFITFTSFPSATFASPSNPSQRANPSGLTHAEIFSRQKSIRVACRMMSRTALSAAPDGANSLLWSDDAVVAAGFSPTSC